MTAFAFPYQLIPPMRTQNAGEVTIGMISRLTKDDSDQAMDISSYVHVQLSIGFKSIITGLYAQLIQDAADNGFVLTNARIISVPWMNATTHLSILP